MATAAPPAAETPSVLPIVVTAFAWLIGAAAQQNIDIPAFVTEAFEAGRGALGAPPTAADGE